MRKDTNEHGLELPGCWQLGAGPQWSGAKIWSTEIKIDLHTNTKRSLQFGAAIK